MGRGSRVVTACGSSARSWMGGKRKLQVACQLRECATERPFTGAVRASLVDPKLTVGLARSTTQADPLQTSGRSEMAQAKDAAGGAPRSQTPSPPQGRG